MRSTTFACPDVTTFCRLDDLGLEVTGQRLEPDRAVLVRDLATLLEAGSGSIDCWVLDDVTAISEDLVLSLLDYGLGFEADLPILLRRLSRRRMCVVIAILTYDSVSAGRWEEYADVMVRMEGASHENDTVQLSTVDETVLLERISTHFVEVQPQSEHS